MKRSLLPALLLATGILVSTFVAVATSERGWVVLSAPCVMVGFMMATFLLIRRQRGAAAGSLPLVLVLGGALILACLITALADPRQVATILPVLSGGGAVPLLTAARNDLDRGCAPWRRA